jgi:hypothetical protein
MKRFTRLILPLLVAIVLIIGIPLHALAAPTADISVTATPQYVAISCDQASYDFGVVAASATPSTATNWATIDNTSSVQTDQTISVTAASWSGGATWTHSDTATAGADTAGLSANKGGSWGTGDVIIKNASPNYIAENQAATTDYSFGLKLYAPTSFTDGVQKSITVRVSAAAG